MPHRFINIVIPSARSLRHTLWAFRIRIRDFVLIACLLGLLPPVSPTWSGEGRARERRANPTGWARTSGHKIFDVETHPSELNKKINVVQPQKLEGPFQFDIPTRTGNKVWVCEKCGRILPPEEITHQNIAKLEKGEFTCPRCDSRQFEFIPETRAALQLKAISKNLVPNGSFERGRWWPYLWEPVDRLGSFWVEGGTTGRRCMKFNTDLVEKQWLPFSSKIITSIRKLQERTGGRAQQLDHCPLPDPPKPKASTAPYYDTVAGLHGIHYKGPYIPLQPGAIYRVSVDVRCEPHGGAKVFVKGFYDQERKTTEGLQTLKRNAYRAPMSLHGLNTKWKRFARIFRPARSKSTYKGHPMQPEWLQVQLYSYWPPGNYWWDNVKLEIVGYEKIDMPGMKAREKPQRIEEGPKGTDDGFPVF
jgi:Zn finger protein HypA/HybF involved in hydrogenase expression